MHLRKDSRAFKILKYLALGSGVVAISMVSPLGGAQLVKEAIKGYFRKKSFEKHRFLKDLKNLQVRELINYRELGGGRVELTITKRGKEIAIINDIDTLQLKKQKRWDGKWRLVMFDIPHYYKKARDAFRLKLKDLGFYRLQKSVFLTPHPCEDEIDFLGSVFGVRHCVLILHVSDFEGSEKLRHRFGI